MQAFLPSLFLSAIVVAFGPITGPYTSLTNGTNACAHVIVYEGSWFGPRNWQRYSAGAMKPGQKVEAYNQRHPVVFKYVVDVTGTPDCSGATVATVDAILETGADHARLIRTGDRFSIQVLKR